jgi:hypothetical protein
MKKAMMTKFYNKDTGDRGDCLRACLASLLDLDVDSFVHSTWIGDYTEILPEFGVYYSGFAGSISDIADSDGIDGNFIAYGEGNRGVLHAVIINAKGDLIHDPHPSNEGVNNIKGIFLIQRM